MGLKQDLKNLGLLPRENTTDVFGPHTVHAVLSFETRNQLPKLDSVSQSLLHTIKAKSPKRSDSAGLPLGVQIEEKALSFLGTPYVWGGESPAGFDCSGFTKYVFGLFGISLPRTAAEQASIGTPVPESSLQPGDLVFFDTEGGISHVGIYIGNGKFISAAGSDIRISNLHNPYYWGPRYVLARHIG